MKKIAFASIALIFITGCTVSQTNSPSENTVTKTAQTLTEKEREKVKKDTRGHHARSMSQTRFDQLLTKYNVNTDQELTWGEYNDWRQARFNKTDTNDNGTVDAEEYVYEYENRLDERYEKGRVAHINQTAQRFDALDKNENKTIEWIEYEASGNRVFARWDTNENGTINKDDPKPESGKKKSKYQRYSENPISFIRMPTSHSTKGMMNIYDADEDGSVSRDEFDNERRSAFYLTDENRDGKLNSNEYFAEFEDRLDQTIDSNRRGQIKQTYVRFGALDDNEDKRMSFDEFQLSGKRIFTRWDKNEDGLISAADIGE